MASTKKRFSIARVGINGFGRIGRCLFRLNHELEQDKRFEVVAIKDIVPIENIAYLLKHDSHYGEFRGEIDVKKSNLVVDGQKIPYFQKQDVADVPWERLGVNILVEASGVTSSATLKSLLKGCLTNVVYGRSMEGTDITIIYGVNHNKYNPKQHKTISAGSCTGNAIVPIAEIINSHFGIKHGHLISVHPVLSEQKVVDVAHSKFNLGRNAMISIIPTSSGIPGSIAAIIPELNGKITALSYRVPTTIVSVLDANFSLKKRTTAEEVNSLLKRYAVRKYKGIIKFDEGYMGHSRVSVDFLKSPYSVVVLGLETQSRGQNISLSMFHDNEWSYSFRFHDLMRHINKINQKDTYAH